MAKNPTQIVSTTLIGAQEKRFEFSIAQDLSLRIDKRPNNDYIHDELLCLAALTTLMNRPVLPYELVEAVDNIRTKFDIAPTSRFRDGKIEKATVNRFASSLCNRETPLRPHIFHLGRMTNRAFMLLDSIEDPEYGAERIAEFYRSREGVDQSDMFIGTFYRLISDPRISFPVKRTRQNPRAILVPLHDIPGSDIVTSDKQIAPDTKSTTVSRQKTSPLSRVDAGRYVQELPPLQVKQIAPLVSHYINNLSKGSEVSYDEFMSQVTAGYDVGGDVRHYLSKVFTALVGGSYFEKRMKDGEPIYISTGNRINPLQK